MGNKNKQNVQTGLNRQSTRNTADYGSFLDRVRSERPGVLGRESQLWQGAVDRYTDPNRGMSVTPTGAGGWFNLPGGGVGQNTAGGGGGSQFSGSARGGYEKLAETGGINREDWKESQDLYRRSATGYVPGAENLRYRATSMVPAFYDQYKNQLARRANTQGGYSPGFDAQMAEIGRQAGREGYDASRKAEADIADRAIQQMQFGTTGLSNIAGTMNELGQRGTIAGLGGMTDIDALQAQYGEAAAGRNLAANKYDQDAQLELQRMWQQGQQFGATGMTNLYGTTPGESSMLNDVELRGMGDRERNELANLGISANMNQGHWWDSLGGIGSIVGGVGSVWDAYNRYRNPTGTTQTPRNTGGSDIGVSNARPPDLSGGTPPIRIPTGGGGNQFNYGNFNNTGIGGFGGGTQGPLQGQQPGGVPLGGYNDPFRRWRGRTGGSWSPGRM